MRSLSFLLIFLFSVGYADSEILKVEIDGVIDPITSAFIARAIDEAADSQAEFLLIELSTPGGLGVSMQEIVQKILNSKVPIVCFVQPTGARAASAGFFILLSADVAAMAPGTNTGAAHPVFPFGEADKTMLEKVTNDFLANLRAIVNQRERNYDLAEKGVVESKSYTAREALEGGLIDLIAENEEDLLRSLEGREITRFLGERQTLSVAGKPIRKVEMTWREEVLSGIADPNVAMLLGLVGLLGLYLEFTHPGGVVPGVVGGISLLLALTGFSLIPLNMIGVLLILLALALFVAEVKVQGFGILGLGGIVSLTLGLLFLVDDPNPEVRIQWGPALAVAASFGVIVLFLLRLTVKAYLSQVVTGTGSLLGATGSARTAVGPSGGKVFISGEWWNAVSDEPIGEGCRVRVVGQKDMLLTVVPQDEFSAPGADLER